MLNSFQSQIEMLIKEFEKTEKVVNDLIANKETEENNNHEDKENSGNDDRSYCNNTDNFRNNEKNNNSSNINSSIKLSFEEMKFLTNKVKAVR